MLDTDAALQARGIWSQSLKHSDYVFFKSYTMLVTATAALETEVTLYYSKCD